MFASYNEILKLDERLKNFCTWQMEIKTNCYKQNCLNVLKQVPQATDKIGANNCKNVNFLIANSIDDEIKITVLKKRASESLMPIYK